MTGSDALRLPALLPAAGALAGVLTASAQSVFGFALAAVSIIAALYFYRRLRSAPWVLAAAFGLFFIITSALAPPPAPTAQTGIFTAQVESVSVGRLSQQLVVTVEAQRPYRVGVTLTDLVPHIYVGDSIRFKSYLRPGDIYADVPFVHAEGLAQRAQRLSATAVVFKGDISVIGHKDTFLSRVDRSRTVISDAVYASGLPPTAAAMLTASCLGSESLPPEEKAAFRDAGLAHLFCISGFHVGLVAAAAAFLLYPLRLIPHGLLIRRLGVLIIVWLYVILTGFTPSGIRAATMVTIAVGALGSPFLRNGVNTLAVAFMVVLLIQPYRLYSAGFQLSFAAAAGLILLAPTLNPISWSRRSWHSLAAMFTVPLAASIATLPVMLAWGLRVPLLVVPANTLAALMFPLFMLSGLGGVYGSAMSASGAGHIHAILMHISAYGSSAGHAPAACLPAHTAALICLSVAVALVVLGVNLQGRRRGISILSAAILCVAVALLPHPEPEQVVYAHGDTSAVTLNFIRDGIPYRIPLDGDDRQADRTPFASYFAAHGFDFPQSLGADFAHTSVSRTGDSVRVGQHTFRLVGRHITDTLSASSKSDILIISRRFKGDVGALLNQRTPAAVILSAGLPDGLRDSFIKHCHHAAIPCHDLRSRVATISVR